MNALNLLLNGSFLDASQFCVYLSNITLHLRNVALKNVTLLKKVLLHFPERKESYGNKLENYGQISGEYY